MNVVRSAMTLLKTLSGPTWKPRVRSRRDILKLSRLLDTGRFQFILYLIDEELNLLDVWRLPRLAWAAQGFPLNKAVELAVRVKADGMILVQLRDDGDMIVRDTDAELTRLIKRGLDETGTEFVDHLLISGEASVSVTWP